MEESVGNFETQNKSKKAFNSEQLWAFASLKVFLTKHGLSKLFFTLSPVKAYIENTPPRSLLQSIYVIISFDNPHLVVSSLLEFIT